MRLSISQRLLECEEALRTADQQNDLLTEALTELMSAARPYLEPGGYPYGNPAMAKARAALKRRNGERA